MTKLKSIRFAVQVLLCFSISSLVCLAVYSFQRNVGSNRSSDKVTHGVPKHTVLVASRSTNKKRPSSSHKEPLHSQPTVQKITATPGNKTRNGTRYLIYLCDRFRVCGGWSDRQRGLATAYLLSVATGRRFGVNMTFPCDVKMFLAPNEVNWYIKVDEIRGLSWEIASLMNRQNEPLTEFNERHPSDVVFLRTNHDHITLLTRNPNYTHLFPKEYKSKNTAFGAIWRKLMKPSVHLEEMIDRFMTNVPSKGDFICAHVRMRFKDDGAKLNSLTTIGSLWSFLSKYEKNASRIFIASDTVEVRESARERFGSKELDTNGVVLHMDRHGKRHDACKGFEIAMLEQAILAKCKLIVLTQSGFGGRASMISLIKQKRFMFINGTIITLPDLVD